MLTKRIPLAPFVFIFVFTKINAQDTLKFNRYKDVGIYATSNYNIKYPQLKFLKHRLITPTLNIYDNNQGLDTHPVLNLMSYLALVNDLDVSNINDDAKINMPYIQSKMAGAANTGVTPISISLVEYYLFKDSAMALNYVGLVTVLQDLQADQTIPTKMQHMITAIMKQLTS